MVDYERFHRWANVLIRRVIGYEGTQSNGENVTLLEIEITKREIDHVSSNSLPTDRLKLERIRQRLVKVEGIEQSRPVGTAPIIRHMLGTSTI
jgi:hypothetical protein